MSTMTVGERLKYFREIHGLTQSQMAIVLKDNGYAISESTYKRLEKEDSEPTLKFIIAFINALKNMATKDNINDKPISIFSFIYGDSDFIDNNDKKELNVFNDAIYNLSNLPKYFDKRLFEDLFDTSQPFYKYIIGCPEFISFLNDIEPLFAQYKNISNKKQIADIQIAKDSKQANDKNEYIKKKIAKTEYQNDYVKPLNMLKLNIRNFTLEFINKLLDYYCKH